MIRNEVGFVFVMLVPVALTILWLIAEFHWRMVWRVALGLFNMLLLTTWLYAVTYSSQSLFSRHHLALWQIESLIEDGRETHVLRSIARYNEVYDRTRRARLSALELSNFLMRGDPEEADEG